MNTQRTADGPAERPPADARTGPYGAAASVHVPQPTIRRRETLLAALRGAAQPVTVAEFEALARAAGEHDYSRGLAYKDLNELERRGFAVIVWNPRRWTATQDKRKRLMSNEPTPATTKEEPYDQPPAQQNS